MKTRNVVFCPYGHEATILPHEDLMASRCTKCFLEGTVGFFAATSQDAAILTTIYFWWKGAGNRFEFPITVKLVKGVYIIANHAHRTWESALLNQTLEEIGFPISLLIALSRRRLLEILAAGQEHKNPADARVVMRHMTSMTDIERSRGLWPDKLPDTLLPERHVSH